MEHYIIKEVEKQRNKAKERFEPLPLYMPLYEMPAHDMQEDKAEHDKKAERGVWTTDI